MFAALLAALTLATPDPGFGIVPVSLPSTDKPPIVREGTPRPGDATPAPRKRVFVLGIRFQNRGGSQGIALEQVVAGSPADRAGFTVGMVITEIDGRSTAGHSAEDCTRMVQEAGTTVPLKYYDPLTFKLRARTVDKEWIPVPTN
ncbi:MAG: PDZ domain-containing protein [Chthoniobacter sp.]|uniref:PDZ domain-containing protein n=1 Tax=Chthoniobacter sp. TaxID=2510640 RepID=UPI0032A79A99